MGRGQVDGLKTLARRASSLAATLVLAALCFAAECSADAGVLEAARARGHLVCGVPDGPAGYSKLSGDGEWTGIGVDFCKALAAAVLDSKDAVKFQAVPPSDRFATLKSGAIDVLTGEVALAWSHEMEHGIRFPGVLAFEGQGFMVRRSHGVASALELSGARVCVTAQTADAEGVADYFGALKMPYEIVRLDRWQEAVAAYINKGCQALSAELSVLAQARQQSGEPDKHTILPEVASRQLIGPAIRQGDDDWFSTVRWTLYALIAAEELGVTSANVDAMKASKNAKVRRLLGLDMDLGGKLGFGADWTQRVIRQVGNYGELFERNLGLKSPLKLERRLNGLASQGGLHYAPAFR
jgi:general L-amino acid transport system substrate-binding protein